MDDQRIHVCFLHFFSSSVCVQPPMLERGFEKNEDASSLDQAERRLQVPSAGRSLCTRFSFRLMDGTHSRA